MSRPYPTEPQRCKARAKHSNSPCKNFAMRGQRVCQIHGGKAPQNLRKAEERMRDLVQPAISSLSRQVQANEFPATKYVLDWAGFKAAEKFQTDQEITIRVVTEDQPITVVEHHYELGSNGHST